MRLHVVLLINTLLQRVTKATTLLSSETSTPKLTASQVQTYPLLVANFFDGFQTMNYTYIKVTVGNQADIPLVLANDNFRLSMPNAHSNSCGCYCGVYCPYGYYHQDADPDYSVSWSS
jgi:hypothetical protein